MEIIVYLLIAVNVYVFYLMYKGKYDIDDLGASYLYVVVRKDYKRLITSGFTHSGIFHLLINMYSFSSVGSFVLRVFGPFRFFLTYFLSMTLGQLFALYIRHNNSDDYTISVGASGAIFGLFGVYLMLMLRMFGIQSIFSSLISMAIISMIPGVDHYSHICSLMVGVILGYLFIII